MVLEEETKIIQSKNAHTQYVTIPASIVRDSQYPFKANEKVKIIVDPYREIMIIASIKGPNIRISSEGIIIDKRRVEVIEK
jgi:hypothetical protein